MKNIVNYDNFSEKDKNVVLDYENFMTNEFWQEAKNLYKKATTTGQEVKQQTKAKGETAIVAGDNINKMDTEQPTGGAVSKFVDKTKSKFGRELTGTNAFIDTKSGKMCAMDVVLPKDDFSKVIELWKAGKKDDAANILKTFAIKERDAQFNIAVGLMMSASIAGLKSLKSQVIPKIDPSKIDMGGALGTDKGSYTGGDQRNFVEAPSEIAKSVGDKVGKVGKGIGKALKPLRDLTADQITRLEPKQITELPGVISDHIDRIPEYSPVELSGKALRKLGKLNNIFNVSDPTTISEKSLKKAGKIIDYLQQNGFGRPEDLEKLNAAKEAIKRSALDVVDTAVGQAPNLTPGQDVVNATTA